MLNARRALTVVAAMLLAWAVAAAPAGADVLVSTGSVSGPFSANSTNEPAVAIDPIHPNILAVGTNDNIDEPACNAGDDRSCAYDPAINTSGIVFSTNGGASWSQPTYTGLSGRACTGVVGDADPECVPATGPIGTLPNYDTAGLRADGDPGVAWGPRRGRHGRFSWANGSRLYYANLTSPLAGRPGPPPFPGYEAVAVSYADDIATARAGRNAAWSTPKIASAQTASTFSDKPQVWADDAASSAHFGNVYVCYDPYTYDPGTGTFDVPPVKVGVSRDGGDTWSQSTAFAADYAADTQPGFSRIGCTVRTDSHGKVYVFAYQQPPQAPGAPITGSQVMVTSDDGGATWSAPVRLFDANDQCSGFELSIFRCVIDGAGGERQDAGAAPSVDIANGAPFGLDATNRIVMTWVDGGAGLGDERVKFTTSGNGGATWTPRRDVQKP
ncbi:MAG TPA: sialidase family protein, partial [Baekduia sp.]|nr:sialidase family protein [Baekduia sp.]